MKILAVSDRIDPRVYSDFCQERFKDVECVISCGDLPEHYLDFIVTNLNVPLFLSMEITTLGKEDIGRRDKFR